METRKCQYCSKPISPEKRADTKFCSNSCKANYWESNKGAQPASINTQPEKEKPKVAGMPLEGLRGVLGNKEEINVTDVRLPSDNAVNQSITPAVIRQETNAYKDALAAFKRIETNYQKGKETYALYEKYLGEWMKEIEWLENTPIRRKYDANNIDALAMLEVHIPLDEVAERQARIRRYKLAKEKIITLKNFKYELDTFFPKTKRAYEAARQKLNAAPQYVIIPTIQPPQSKPAADLFKLAAQLPLPQQDKPQQEEARNEGYKSLDNTPTIQTGSKLMSSRELREMNYKCLNFQNRWKEFFGLPAVVFHLAVHGKPGEGKSTFCIQFADYLAHNFGYVVYVSGEEGFSKTLRDKVVNNKIDNPSLYFADINSYEEITAEIPDNKFHFIFIDSLDTLRIDATRLHELREHYPQSAFITISQSTKDGKMRGSQEIIHDADITVKVENGIAETTKNRFSPRGTEFRVFPTEKATVKLLGEPKNLI
jgi:hypothetical protein